MKKFLYISKQHLIFYISCLIFGLGLLVFTGLTYSSLGAFWQNFLVNFCAGFISAVIVALFVDNISSRNEFKKHVSSRIMFLSGIKNGVILLFKRISKLLYAHNNNIENLNWENLLKQFKEVVEVDKTEKDGKLKSVFNKSVFQLYKEIYNILGKKDLLILHGIINNKNEWAQYDNLFHCLESFDSELEESDNIETFVTLTEVLKVIINKVPEFKDINNLKFYRFRVVDSNKEVVE